MFPNVDITHLAHSHLDHCPLLIHMDNGSINRSTNRFNFKTWWMVEDTFKNVLQNIWETTERDLLAKIDGLREVLMNWAKGIRRKRRRLKKELTRKLE